MVIKREAENDKYATQCTNERVYDYDHLTRVIATAFTETVSVSALPDFA